MYKFNGNLSETVLNNVINSTEFNTANNEIRVGNIILSLNGENVYVKFLPETQEELMGIFLALEQYHTILSSEGQIIDLYLSVTDTENPIKNDSEEVFLLTKDLFSEVFKDVPEWAGISSEEMSRFGAYLAEALEDHESYPALASCILDGLKYSVRYGWYY